MNWNDGVFHANSAHMFILESTTKHVSRDIEVSVVFISVVAAYTDEAKKKIMMPFCIDEIYSSTSKTFRLVNFILRLTHH